MKLSRLISGFLLAFGVWSWVIWVTFWKIVSNDPRSWTPSGSPAPFLMVHTVIIVTSLILGTLVGIIGLRGLIAAIRERKADTSTASKTTDDPEKS